MKAAQQRDISTMSDTTDSDDEAEAPAEQMPEMRTFTVTVIRQFETDFSDNQLQQLLQQSDAKDEAEAVEKIFNEQEKGYIEPEEKLIGIRTQVEEE